MRGEIIALFHRYKSEGGYEYISDFLIGARADGKRAFSTRHGDSGTIWLVDKPNDDSNLMPVALQWGGSIFTGNGEGTRQSFALAACLSTICEKLNVDVIADLSIGLPEYWGALGHYSLATLAIEAIRNPKLKKFFKANLDRISFPVSMLSKDTVTGLSNQDFIPLANVPDLAFKMGPYRRPQAYENANHFADMDKPRPSDGKTLLEICKNHKMIAVTEWKKYYKEVQDKSCGILPFRIWQIYKKMVEYARQGDHVAFLCAAGILSHYVGDACQPLHISYCFNGDPDGEQENGEPVSKGVHSDFDKVMVENFAGDILQDLPALIDGNLQPKQPLVKGGHAAAAAAVELMRRTFDLVDPKDVCNTYAQIHEQKPKQRSMALWKQYKDPMEKVMADGARTLALLWDSAWQEAKGDDNLTELGLVEEKKLSALYQDKTFLPSCNINGISKEL
jgi:hypothetical protein